LSPATAYAAKYPAGPTSTPHPINDLPRNVDCLLLECAVQRRRFHSGCKPRPATAPARSDRSNRGGTKRLKPSVKRVTKYGDSASVQPLADALTHRSVR
jgi:hypothetical protein